MKTKNTFLIAYILLLLTALGCSKSTTNTPLSLKIGDKYQGGTIVYILDAGDAGYDEKVQHGLIASPENLGPAIYSNCGNLINGADATSIGSGKQNTLDIIASCNSASIAAKLCDDYSVIENGKTYDDWYLPSKLELIKVYEQKDLIGDYKKFGYWSSSEINLGFAWRHDFSDNTITSEAKGNANYVRAVRSF